MRIGTMAVVTVIIAALLAACGGGGDEKADDSTAASSPRPKIDGTLNLKDSGEFASLKTGTTCTGYGGYGDIKEGAQVVVRDAGDQVIATGRLGSGSILSYGTCQFDFSVSNVPDAEFYSVEVSHRGALSFSREELAAQGWTVELTLGN